MAGTDSHGVQPSAFGRLLRFWRATCGMSQQTLSLNLGVSARHISFLETGRSSPSPQLVGDLADAFGLAARDTNNLLAAAGYLPRPVTPDLAAPDQHWLRKSAALQLAALEPVPAWIADPWGAIHMVNGGWIALFNERVADRQLLAQPNAYDLYLADSGLRRSLENWEDVACALLLNLQQEVLLADDPGAGQALLERLLRWPGIPADWPQRGRVVPYAHSFRLNMTAPGGRGETWIAVNNTAGATPYVSEPRLILSSLHPLDFELTAGGPGDHPLHYLYAGYSP